jgi:acyl-CoA synthetase (AMP-forming)/AMP-acid ligase II
LIAEEPLPALEGMIQIGAAGPSGWDAFLARGRGPEDPCVDPALAAVGPDDVSDILFTSGTTGSPKGVVSTHGQVVGLFTAWTRIVDLRADDRMLIANPFFHTFGYKAGWVSCLIVGATMVPMAAFDVAATLERIQRDQITFMPGPPTIFQSLLARPRDGQDLGSLRVAVTGAANIPPVLVRRMSAELGFKRVITGYGMTECGAISMCREGDDADTVATTCGGVLPGLEIKCVDDDGTTVAAGTAGEILVRGYGVMKGYLDDPQATAETIDADGWLRTGDIGVLDAAGTLRITDRKKDMYISGGFNCYPAEIEHRLSEHPQVEMVAVIGVPDERLGEVGKAFVVLREGEAISPQALIDWSRSVMANYKAPRFVSLVSDLPRNAAGKVLRAALRESTAR